MLGDSIEPLTDVVDFGNWWHGSWTYGVGFKNRAGATLNDGYNGFSGTNVAVVGTDAHLVDLEMPALTTPAAEIALGLERLNKAVLFGAHKYYAMGGSFTFGAGGWPYQASDGAVWHMKADLITTTNLGIYARRLNNAGVGDWTLLEEITVPYESGYGGVTPVYGSEPRVNFDPMGGAAAAAHSWFYWGTTRQTVCYIAEIALSGGSATTTPTATVAITYNEASAQIEYAVNQDMNVLKHRYREVLVSSTTLVDTYEMVIDEWWYADHPDWFPGGVSYVRRDVDERIISIVYGATGTRHVLSAKYENIIESTGHLKNFTVSGSRVVTRNGDGYVISNVSTYEGSYDQSGLNWESFQFLRNDVAACELLSDVDEVYRINWTEYPPDPLWSGVPDETIVNHKTGNAYDATEDETLFSTLDILAWGIPASNIVQLIGRQTVGGAYLCLAYIGPESAHAHGYGDFATYPAGAAAVVALNPFTGAFAPATQRYF